MKSFSEHIMLKINYVIKIVLIQENNLEYFKLKLITQNTLYGVELYKLIMTSIALYQQLS